MLAVLVLTLLAQALVVQCEPYRCPAGWNQYKGKCYGFGTDYVTWADALTICQLYGGALAEPRDGSLHHWLVTQLRNLYIGAAWVGGTDIFQEGSWVWASDKTAIGSFNKWQGGEPNNHRPGQDCMQLLDKFNYDWDDDRCTELHYFICEKNAI